MEINNQIKFARKKRGITQKELGNYLGYSEAHISYIESGKRKLKLIDVKKTEDFLRVKIDEINYEPLFDKYESKADKLYKIINLLFATSDNIDQIEEIWNK